MSEKEPVRYAGVLADDYIAGLEAELKNLRTEDPAAHKSAVEAELKAAKAANK